MSAKVDIWMPLYVADYLSATSRLTTEQHGAYLLLLMDYWKNGPPPDNDGVLAQITRLSPVAWSNARTMLEAMFQVESGQWLHHRVEQELAKANHNKEVNLRRGKAGAEARYGKKDAPTMLEASLVHSSSPSPSPSPISSSSSSTNTLLVKTNGLDPMPSRIACPTDKLLALFHQECPTLPRVMMLNDKRKKHLVSRWREVDAEDHLETAEDGLKIFQDIFSKVHKSDFLCGRTAGRQWKSNFDWLIQPTNFLKVVEGQYDNRGKS